MSVCTLCHSAKHSTQSHSRLRWAEHEYPQLPDLDQLSQTRIVSLSLLTMGLESHPDGSYDGVPRTTSSPAVLQVYDAEDSSFLVIRAVSLMRDDGSLLDGVRSAALRLTY